MANRMGLLIVTTTALSLAFLFSCISSGTDQWITFEQTGKDAKIIFLKAEQGLFERCIHAKYRSRGTSNNCFSLSDAYDGRKQQSWEKAVSGLMVTATIIMGIAAFFSGILMVSESPRSGIFNDAVPVFVGLFAALLAIIALAVYNSKFELTRTRLIGASTKTYADSEVDYGYSFYVGWLSALLHFFIVFFYYIFQALIRNSEKERQKTAQQYKVLSKPV